MKDAFHTRFKKVIEMLGYRNPSEFGRDKVWGRDIQSKISGYLRGDNVPKQDFLEDMSEKFPKVNYDYLITGRGTPLLSDKGFSDTTTQMLIKTKDTQIQGLKMQNEALNEENNMLARLLEKEQKAKK